MAILEPTYGFQLQKLAVQGHLSEGRIDISYDEIVTLLNDGSKVFLRTPT